MSLYLPEATETKCHPSREQILALHAVFSICVSGGLFTEMFSANETWREAMERGMFHVPGGLLVRDLFNMRNHDQKRLFCLF